MRLGSWLGRVTADAERIARQEPGVAKRVERFVYDGREFLSRDDVVKYIKQQRAFGIFDRHVGDWAHFTNTQEWLWHLAENADQLLGEIKDEFAKVDAATARLFGDAGD